VARGRDTMMLREILDETAERVRKAMTNQPEVEAELCNIIASLYAEIGNVPKGEEIARRALTIRREKFGADGVEAAESLNLLGMLLMMQHKVPEAERAHSEALAIFAKIKNYPANRVSKFSHYSSSIILLELLLEVVPVSSKFLRVTDIIPVPKG